MPARCPRPAPESATPIAAVPPRRPSRSSVLDDVLAPLPRDAPEAQAGGGASRELLARWARIGGLSDVTPYAGVVDLERLLVATAAAGDERLLDVGASWLAGHHVLVFGRRLASMTRALTSARAPAAASLGALLDQAWARALALPVELRLRPENLEIARDCCGARRARGAARTVGDGSPDAVGSKGAIAPSLHTRPVDWVVQHVPELRVRALIGATLEAEIMVAALAGRCPSREGAGDVPMPSVAAVARHAGVSYAGVHGAANRLMRRGLLVGRAGKGRVLQPTVLAIAALEWPGCEATPA